MAQLTSTLKLTLLDQVSARARHITGALNGLQRQTAAMSAVSNRLIAFGATYLGVTQGVQSTVGAAISFESAFADVRKVVEASDEQLQNMERTIRKLSTTIPTTANDLAALYASGAESGIATNELNQFAEMAARVGIAFDIPASQAGESLAKLKTQLGLTLAETGDMADAMNHLSNSMASKASDIQAFMLRVGALAEMGGLAKEEVAALGSAMIAAGAEPETAATAMQNVVKAMTRGASAKKSQKDAAKALGLDLPQLAKDMQRDAPKAIKKVLGAIAKQPKDRHISLLSDFFGDEAKSFAPLVGNIKLLDDALAAVGDRTKFAGSAFREYVERSKTTANTLQILQNKFAELGRGIGDSWLPTIKDAALGIGHVIDTLGSRATIFDQIGTSFKGFFNGLGIKGGAQDAIKALGDLLLGPADGSASADKLGRIFMRFQEFGKQARQFGEDVGAAVEKLEKAFNLKPGTLGDTLGTIAGYGLALGAASIGIALAASAIGALGRALMVLSGASLLLGGAKGLGKLFGAVSGLGKTPALPKTPNVPKVPPVVPNQVPSVIAAWGARLSLWTAGAYSVYKALDSIPHAGFESAQKNNPELLQDLERQRRIRSEFRGGFEGGRHAAYAGVGPRPGGKILGEIENWPPGYRPMSGLENHDGKRRDDANMGSRTIKTVLDSASISALLQPSGVQMVQEVNRQKPVVNVNLGGINITGIADLATAASSAASQLGEKVKSAVESTNTD